MTLDVGLNQPHINRITYERYTWNGTIIIVIYAILCLDNFCVIGVITHRTRLWQIIMFEFSVFVNNNFSYRICKYLCRLLFVNKGFNDFSLCAFSKYDQITCLNKSL